MAWFVAGVMLASLIATLYLQSKVKLGLAPGEIKAPTANEGIPIPVLFGTRQIDNANIVWFGQKSVVRNGQLFDYYAALQFALCHGELDELQAVLAGDKEVWTGHADAEGDSIQLRSQDIGITGQTSGSTVKYWTYDRDGVDGWARVRLGAINSASGAEAGVVDDLAEAMGFSWVVGGVRQTAIRAVPKFYGVATVYTPKAMFVGQSPFLRPWSFVAKRIHKRRGGAAQWFDSLAEVKIGKNREDVWKYHVQAVGDTTDCSGVAFDDSAWSTGPGGVGTAPVDVQPTDGAGKLMTPSIPRVKTSVMGVGSLSAGTWPHTSVVPGTKIWLRADLGPLAIEQLGVRMWHDDSAKLWFNGTQVSCVPLPSESDSEHARFNSTATIPATLIDPSVNIIAYQVTDSFDVYGAPRGTNKYIYAGIQVGPNLNDPQATVDMNPIHIIRECLTDTIWGKGIPDAELEDSTFQTAASTCYYARLGMSVLWDRQSNVDDFIDEVLRHIDGVLYWNRSTGKLEIKLLRDDYTFGDLLVLDETNVESVEDARRKSTGDLVNTVSVTYSSNLKGDAGSLTVHDSGLIAAQGGVTTARVDYPGLTSAHTASRVAARNLKILSTPLMTCTLSASREAADLMIGDPFVLDWPPLDIEDQVMRVTSIDVGDGLRNQVKIVAVEDAFFQTEEALVVPAPIYWPPVTLAPIFSARTRLCLAQTLDPNDHGQVVCCYLGPHFAGGNTPMFSGDWAESEPGVLLRATTGPLDADWFDGVEPDSDNHSGVPWMVGKTIFAYYDGTDDFDEALQGPWVVDDVGGHWVDWASPAIPSTAFVSTQARFHRPEGYAKGSDYTAGMTFQAQAGTVYATDYFTLTTYGLVLGETPQAWTHAAGPTYVWTAGRKLLTPSQIGTEAATMDVVDETVTCGLAGADFDAFCSIDGVPGVESIQSGDWQLDLEGLWLTSVPVGSTTRLGVKIIKTLDGATGTELFQAVSSPVTATAATAFQFKFTVPQIKIGRTYRLLLIPFVQTDVAAPGTVTMHLRYNGLGHVSALTIPSGVGVLPERDARGGASFADGIAVIPGRAWSAEIALTGDLLGVAIEDYQDGDVIHLALTGASGGTPRNVLHGETVPSGCASLFLGSLSGLGSTYLDVKLKASPARMSFQYDAANSRFLLVGGPIV